MIDVAEVLRAVPPFDRFCSVAELQACVQRSRESSQEWDIRIAGTSRNGAPIHHLRCGKGSVKALFVAFPHPNEPIGGLTVFSLMSLLNAGHPQLVQADVEWHIVPCIDPDGARLNEGWSQQEFTFDGYLRHFHRQELRDQAECSFPLHYKRLVFDQPTPEAKVLKELLTQIRPDFYYSLHNLPTGGGAYYLLTRDIEQKYHRELYGLLEQHRVPLQAAPGFGDWMAGFGPGIREFVTTRSYYDFLEKTQPRPEEVVQFGACSYEYLAEIKNSAMTFVAELPLVRHPSDGSSVPTGQNLRQLRLRMDAENKFVATVILEEWQRVKADLDTASPFYRKVFNGVISTKDQLHDGLPFWPYKTRDVLLNPAYSRTMTEGERLIVYQEQFFLLCQYYEFVRLLQASAQSAAVRQATGRLESLFNGALDDLRKAIRFEDFEVIDCNTLAMVQLGSGLVVLNSILEQRRGT